MLVPQSSPLLRVCQLLNEAEAMYLICGAQTCILHGLVRTTEAVDILVEATEENCARVIKGLSKLAVEVDVSTHARKVTYTDAVATSQTTVVQGVRIPFLSLDSLILSKETYREQDAFDRLRLLELKRRAHGS